MVFNKLLISILLLAVTIIMIIFLVFPEYKEFRSLQDQIALKQAEKNAKYAYYSEVNKVYDELIKRKEGVEKIDRAIPDQVTLAPIIYFIQRKSIENGLLVKDIFFNKIPQKVDKASMKDIVFSVNLVGSYSAIKNFLKSLEYSANLFGVNSISFAGQQSQNSQTYSFSMEIKTYSY